MYTLTEVLAEKRKMATVLSRWRWSVRWRMLGRGAAAGVLLAACATALAEEAAATGAGMSTDRNAAGKKAAIVKGDVGAGQAAGDGVVPRAAAAPAGGTAALPADWRAEVLGAAAGRTSPDGEVVASKAGVELRTRNLVKDFWRLEAAVPVRVPLVKGQVGLIRFAARSVRAAAMTGETNVTIYLQQSSEPWTKIFVKQIDLGSDWQRFDIPLQIDESFEAGKSGLYFGFGTAPQVAEIADVQMLLYAPTTDIKTLPRTSRPVGEVSAEAFSAAVARIQAFRKSVMSDRPEAIATPGRTLHVAVQAAAGGDGSKERPFATVQAAVDAAQPGDVVLVGAGTYDTPANSETTITRSGRPDAWIAIRAAPGPRPKFVTRGWHTFEVQGASYIEIRGFECMGVPDPKIDNSGNGIGVIKRGSHVRVIDNVIHGYGGGGLYGYVADFLHFEGNVIHHTSHGSSWGNSGISLYQCFHSTPAGKETGYRNVVRRNVLYGNENRLPFRFGSGGITDGNGIIIDDGRNTQHDSTEGEYRGWTLVENNLVFNNGGRGIHAYLSDCIDVINNTTYMNQFSPDIRGGELTAAQSGSMTFFNNVVIPRREKRANSADGAKSDLVLSHNLFFNSEDVLPGMDGIVGVDPRLRAPDVNATDPEAFAPVKGSPVVDAAFAPVAPADDLFGRPRGANPDLGAIELQAGAPGGRSTAASGE